MRLVHASGLLVGFVSACGGNTAASRATPSVVADNENNPVFVVADDRAVYWADYCVGSGCAIRSVPFDSVQSTALVADPAYVAGLAVDHGDLYWIAEGAVGVTMGLYLFALPSGGTKRLLFMDEQFGAHGVAVDDLYVYWFSEQGVMRGERAGTSFRPLVPRTESLWRIAVRGQEVFWIEIGMNGGTLLKANRESGSVLTLATSPSPFGIAVDDLDVYWSDYSGSVKRVSRQGGATVDIHTGSEHITEIALDEANLYWATAEGNLWTQPRNGSEATVVAKGVDVQSLAVSASALFWGDAVSKRVMRIDKAR
jgi:hypothetical protein